MGFTEIDLLEKYHKNFNESELGRLHSVFPFERMAKAAGLSEQRLERRNIFSPTDMKLLWESFEWLYRHICKHCGELGIRRPRNKYRNVAKSCVLRHLILGDIY